MDELYQIYYEHYFYDNPDDVQTQGYEENYSDDGQKYYSFEGDDLLNRCEKLIGDGREDEALELLNNGVDFSWESTFEDDIIERHKLEQEKAKNSAISNLKKKSNFLAKMGVE